MTIKITAITLSVCAVVLYVLATMFPNDPFFYAISSNVITIFGRLVLAACLLHLAFYKQSRFHTVYGRQVAIGFACGLVMFAMAGIAIQPLSFALFSLFKPLDYLLFLQSGVTLGLVAIMYERGTKRLPRITRPRNPQLRLFSPRNA